MTWAQTAKRYASVFAAAHESALHRSGAPARCRWTCRPRSPSFRRCRIGHFLSLCDNTGMLQHAVHSVADRAHGYCVDDNARALLLSSALANSGEAQLLSEIDTTRFAAFVQHAWNPDTRRFRNFMSYDRRWLEESGSEDSHGRTLWALGRMRALGHRSVSPQHGPRRFSRPRFRLWRRSRLRALGRSRSWAWTPIAHWRPKTSFANGMRKLLADRLMALFFASQRQDWLWFEDVLAYDNARLSQALIQTGLATHTRIVRRGWPSIAPLAHVASDRAVRMLQAGWLQELRQDSPASPRRSTSSRSRRRRRFRLALPRGARTTARSGRRSRDARIRLVSWRKRPADGADRSRHGKLFGWPSSGPAQRE